MLTRSAAAVEDRPTVDAPIDSVPAPPAVPLRVTEDLGVRGAPAPLEPSAQRAALPASIAEKPAAPQPVELSGRESPPRSLLRRWWLVTVPAVLCAIAVGIAAGPWRLPRPGAGPNAAPDMATDLARITQLPDQAAAERDLASTPDLTSNDDNQAMAPVEGPSATPERAERRPLCPLPTLRCIYAVGLPGQHAEFILEALRRADIRLCAPHLLRITYHPNTLGQQVLEVSPSTPTILSVGKKVRFLHVLDGKLPPGQQLRTPVLIKCSES